MNANVTLVVCSILILGSAFLFGRLRWSRLDVVDVYVLAVAAFFGGYTLIDALVKDLPSINPFLAALVLLTVAISVGVTWLLSRLLPESFRRALQMRRLLALWARADGRVILLLLILLLAFQAYSYLRFGIIFTTGSADFGLWEVAPPYWFTSALSLFPLLVFSLCLAGASKVLVSKGKTQIFWIAVLAVVVLIAAQYGRRSVFYVMFVLLILWSLAKGRNLFSLKSVPLMLAALAVLFVFSNLYQNYRSTLLVPDTSITSEVPPPPGILDAALDAEATLSNLRLRGAMWKFNYMILYEQHNSDVEIPYGDILGQAFKNSIPSVLWPGKSVYDLDEMTADLYGFPIPDDGTAIDYGTNNFASTQADFGYLSLVVLPLLLLFVFASMALLVRITRRYPVLLLLSSALFLYYLLNIETNYASFFILYRNIALVAVIYLVAYATLRFLALLLHKLRSLPVQERTKSS